jgi:hypothetical protein
MKIILYVFQLFCCAFFSLQILAGDSVSSAFKHNGSPVRVILKEEDWKHIAFGEQKEDRFLGGHDFEHYLSHYLVKDHEATAYFDTNLSAYIVSSLKGDSLPNIISNLQKGEVANYHTLFPPKVLSRDFVLRAFEKSFKEGGIDQAKSHFHTDFNDFSVAGYFYQREDCYYIRTLFPDFTWYYRTDFGSNKLAKLSIARFLKWNRAGQNWLLQGESISSSLMNTLMPELRKFWPTNVAEFIQDDSTVEDSTMTAAQFVATEKAIEHIRQHFTNTDGFFILNFFFSNQDEPTDQEIEFLQKTLRDYVGFSYTFKSSENKRKNKGKLMLIKIHLKKFIDKQASIDLLHPNSDGTLYSISTKPLGQRKDGNKIITGFHFAEEILQQMLLLNFFEHSVTTSPSLFAFSSAESRQTRIKAAQLFAHNFMRWIVGNKQELFEALSANSLTIGVRLIRSQYQEKSEEYELEVVLKNDGSAEIDEQGKTHTGIFYIRGNANNPLEFGFNAFKTI